jgi:hypothetical protein
MKEIVDHVKYMIILIKESDYAIDGTQSDKQISSIIRREYRS